MERTNSKLGMCLNKKEPGVLVTIVEVDNDQRAQKDPQQEIL